MSETWIVTTRTGETANLAAVLGDDATGAKALAIGPRELAEEAARVVAEVVWIEAEGPVENHAKAAADYLTDAGAQAAIGYATPGVRAALGIWGQSQGARSISNVLVASGAGAEGHLSVEHATVDNRVIETLDVPAPACLLVDTLGFQPADPGAGAPQGAIERVDVEGTGTVELVSSEPVPESGVETADYVVGVGRGVGTQESFEKAKALADTLGAEMSGSMPGVRDFGYFPETTAYIGLSGVNLSAKVYFALGISGSTPHLVGLMNAEKVVCVNNDENARLFDHADYGIVGDVDEVVPEIVRALG